jgi:hypothetical protein
MNVLVLNPDGCELSRLVGKVLKLRMEERYKTYGVRTFMVSIKELDGFRVGDFVLLTSYSPEYLSKIYSLPNADKVSYEGFFPEDVLMTAPLQMASKLVVHNIKTLFEPWVVKKECRQADGATVTETRSWLYTPSNYDKSVLSLNGIELA